MPKAHDILGMLGCIPGIGEVFDIADAVIYATEGNYTQAAISMACALPGVGTAVAGMKYATKASKIMGKTLKIVGKGVTTAALAQQSIESAQGAYTAYRENGCKIDKNVVGKAVSAAANGFLAAVTGKSLAHDMSSMSKTLGGVKSKTGIGKKSVQTPEGHVVEPVNNSSTFATDTSKVKTYSSGRPTQGQGFSNNGYNPQPGERTFEGYIRNNVSADAELSLHTNSAGFNNNNGNIGGNFKRFGVNSHAGISPHVHQPIRNAAPNGNIYGGVGSKTANGGVTVPTRKDIKQLYDYLNNGKYQ